MKVAIAFMLVALSCLFATCAAFNLPQMDNLEPVEKYYYMRRIDICIEKYGTAMNTEAADKDFQMRCALNAVMTVVREMSDVIGCPMEEILQEMGISDMTLEEMEGVISGATTANDLEPEQCEDILIDLIEGLIDTVLSLLEGLLGPAFAILDGLTGEGGPLGAILGGEGGGILGSVLGGENGGLLGSVLGGESGGLVGSLLGGEQGLLGGILGGGLLGGSGTGKNDQSEQQSVDVLDDYVKVGAVEETVNGVDVSEGIDVSFIESDFQEGINSNFGGMLGENDGSTFSSNIGQYVTSSMEEYGEGFVVEGSISEQIGGYDTIIEEDALGAIKETNAVEITKIIEEEETVEEWAEESEKDDDNNNYSQITSSKRGNNEGSAWEIIGTEVVELTSEEDGSVETIYTWEVVETVSELEGTTEQVIME